MASSGIAASGPRGRTRWRRFALIMLPCLAAAVLLVVLTAQSVVAVSFAISGTPFTVTAKKLQGTGFEQFGILDRSVLRNLTGHTNQKVLTANAIRSATLTDLCQSLTLLGLSLRITAGTGSTPVSASDLVVDADRFSGNAKFNHFNIGQDASTVNTVPGVKGPAGEFAMEATSLTITNLRQHAYAVTAGTFTLPGFSLSFGGHC